MGETSDIATVISRARVVVCVGPGGVGKTSTSAAIAMQAAHAGRRVIVLTIDPARRLANALGLPEIGNEERAIPSEAFLAVGAPAPRGRLTAMMLDIKRTWDETVMRHHPDPERRDRLLKNRFYQTLSTALAGSQEYMAMEKLHELAERTQDHLDLIVLDTPPSSNAIDFLEAPAKLIDALDNDATRWLLEPYLSRGRLSTKLFDAGSSLVLRSLSRFTGVETLQELAELLQCFQGMFDGFRQRAKAVRAILSDPRTTFLVVAAPRAGSLADARIIYDRLKTDHIPVGGLILNRATVNPFGAGVEPAPARLRTAVTAVGGTPSFADRIEAVALEAQAMAQDEQAQARRLIAEAPDVPVALIPELPRDVHDLAGLDALRRHLFGLESPS